MPELDDRIERALRESARSPDADPGVVARGVERKKVRRQARRNAATGALVAAVLVTTAVVTVAIVRRDGGEDRRVSTPPSTTAAQPADPVAAQEEIAAVLPGPELSPPEYLSDTEAVVDMESARGVRVEYVGGNWQIDPSSACRVDADAACGPPDVRVTEGFIPLGPEAYAGVPAGVERLPRPVTEYARTPLVSTGDASWVAVYDREGASYGFPPSHLVDLNSGQRIDLEGEILSFAAGEDGTLWAVTRDRIVDTDGTEFRLKHIDGDGIAVSNPIPPEFVPAGPVVPSADAVWVPVRNGVLRFGPDGTGPNFRVEFTTDQERGVAVLPDGAVVGTDGASLLRLDPEGARVPGDPLVDTAVVAPLTRIVLAGDRVWALTGNELLRFDPDLTTIDARVALPVDLTLSSLAAAGDRVVVTAVADLAQRAEPGGEGAQSVAVEPIALVVSASGIEDTIVVGGGNDTAVALEPSGDLLFTSNGSLYRAQLP